MGELSLDSYIEDKDSHRDNLAGKDIGLGCSRIWFCIRANSLGFDNQENTPQKDW